ncbi:MAG: hypothetical protein HY912_22415 [Desulfomonile tiedjei]|uniref:Uncharacterized protein n=1 Tax=Desulfomonile tiedjei TaxID=2358 RepID=A0A9D6V7Q0_9BACT|nr:hypothetical protein [Desulfomonile tiedjei]
MEKKLKNRFFSAAIVGTVFVAVLTSASFVTADPGKTTGTTLPAGLFLKAAPPNAIDVGAARKAAEEGKPIVIRGRIGGTAKPIADKYAMFLVTDLSLALCKDGCADFCQMPREQLTANTAAIQVVDNTGRPLKVSIEGVNGLKPLTEVVVQGTVAKRDNNFLVINAQSIFVDSNAK